MNAIVLAIIIVTIVGLLGAAILVAAAKFMAVYEDPRVGEVTAVLAGANCGGCGYAGCSDYAKAVVEGNAPIDKCAPGGAACMEAISKIMGVGASSGVPKRAMVACSGTSDKCKLKFDYQGIETCAAAASVSGGPNACSFGCIGKGDCVASCKFDAIHVVNGVAVVDRQKCTGCSACTVVCPKHIIFMKPLETKPVVECSNREKGPVVMKECTAGCIGCMLCQKNCPEGAITVKDFVASIDYEKCTGCGICTTKCPKKVIYFVDGKPEVPAGSEASASAAKESPIPATAAEKAAK